MAAEFYSPADQLIYKDNQFIPQEQYRLAPYPNIHEGEEEATENVGIPYTGAFTNSGRSNDNAAALGAYTGREYNPESYITNRGTLGKYIQGTEPEENYMQKIGGMIKSGIGMAIPGGNFLMNMVGKLDNFKNLSPADQEFARQQMSFQEQSVHPGGNLDNQDRYGYNKRSMMGNYADVITKRVDIANKRLAAGKELRDIDQYYLDKEEEQKTLTNQMEFNDFIRQRQAANKFRAQQAKGIKTSYKPDIHGGGEDTSTIIDTGSTYEGPIEHDFDPKQGGKAAEPGTPGAWYPGARDGGRIGFFEGALADTAEGKAMSPGTTAGGEFRGGGDNEPPTKKKLSIVPTYETKQKWDAPWPTGVVGFDASTPLGRLKAKMNLKNYVKGDDVEPQIDYTKNIGNFNLAATTDLDNYNLSATYDKGPFTLDATIDDQGNKYIGGKLSWKWGGEDGGLVSIL